ncbi:unnamed protein product (macronuclear) [Paramecium tetraurelia]|uniref:Uncharacterized protein n=1 Tax=Paramecium tetraurelia TaxID=5888 RepID=A0BIN5_PARTE|nr:uncharacterized protein GSPATT00004774001 [Paramecium tetraurelia]CAK58402.1 unnamed protein product [Paramecium tetraurelia]|eukprot:XP_001425800.1 hypothetical protein (macronuclear) [Paramecium tetraurelia strain d4-2]
MNSISQVDFEWNPVSGVLINEENDNIQIDPKTKRKADPKEFGIEIHPHVLFKKSLNYDLEAGWSWHKSWNLPEFDYILKVNMCFSLYQDAHIQVLASQGTLFAQVFVVKALENSLSYRNLGIKGESKKEIIDLGANFRCLKFTTTSYNNNHKKFHLMIVLFYSSVKGETMVLSSIISPEIFVDSRKYARFHNFSVLQNSFTEIFPYQLIDSKIIKRETKNKILKIIKIENSIIGFINYFTASNIRNKIKHPIFLALRFSSLIKLFVDQEMLDSSTNIVTQIQNHLNNIINKLEHQKKIKILISLSNGDYFMQKKALELIQQLENSCYEIYTQKCYLPNTVCEIEDLQQLTLQYQEFVLQSKILINQNKHCDKINTQFSLQVEDNLQKKVKIEQFPDSFNNQLQQTFKDINLHKTEFENSIKKEEDLKIQQYSQSNIFQQYIPFSNINQYQQYFMSPYQNLMPFVNQQFQHYHQTPYPLYMNPFQNMWKLF